MKDFLLRAAVVKLHDWADKQEEIHASIKFMGTTEKVIYTAEARQIAFRQIVQEMRTLFAGLIDFDE